MWIPSEVFGLLSLVRGVDDGDDEFVFQSDVNLSCNVADNLSGVLVLMFR